MMELQEILMEGTEEELSALHLALHARCVNKDNTEIYRNILIYVPDLTNITTQQANRTDMYSVIVLGIDAFSQMNLIRLKPIYSPVPSNI